MAIITEEIGNIFLAPPKSVLIHACNARGTWGAGVALTFKQKYPNAYHTYTSHCQSPPIGSNLSKTQHQASLVGTTLLIGPDDHSAVSNQRQTPPHYIACLFTSQNYGKKLSPADEIVENTRNALKDLARQIAELRASGREVGDCYAVRINSGRFGVAWQRTKAVLEAGDLDITVLRPKEEKEVDGAGDAADEKLVQPSGKGRGSKG